MKFSKTISSKSKNIVKENSEYLGIFYLLKLINYPTDMCWNGQGTTIVDSWMRGMWQMCFFGANFHIMATKNIDFFFWAFLNIFFLRRKL